MAYSCTLLGRIFNKPVIAVIIANLQRITNASLEEFHPF